MLRLLCWVALGRSVLGLARQNRRALEAPDPHRRHDRGSKMQEGRSQVSLLQNTTYVELGQFASSTMSAALHLTSPSPCKPPLGTLGQLHMQSANKANDFNARFFLLEEGDFNFNDTVQCFLASLNATLEDDDFDLRLMPNEAEHLTDLWLLQLLRKHPRRTMNMDEAGLFVLGAPLFTSLVASRNGKCGTEADHERRASRVATALQGLHPIEAKDRCFDRSWESMSGKSCDYYRDNEFCTAKGTYGGGWKPAWGAFDDHAATSPIDACCACGGGRRMVCDGCNLLVINSSPSFRQSVGQDLLRLLWSKRILVATADHGYHHQVENFWSPAWHFVVIPYKAHYVTERFAREGLNGIRKFDFMFHGNLHRRNAGQGRPMVKELASVLPRVTLQDTNFKEYSSPEDFQRVSNASARFYTESSFCFVPAGDSPTSRRLFDALAAGCIPIVLAEFADIAENLPFPHAVDWPEIALFAGALNCSAAHKSEVQGWLESLCSKDDMRKMAGKVRDRGREIFRERLSYKSSGMVDALLREVEVIWAKVI